MIAMVNAELRDQILVVIPFALFDRFFKRKAEQQKQQMKTSNKFDDEDYFGMLSWNPLGEITECFPIRRETEHPPHPPSYGYSSCRRIYFSIVSRQH